MYRILVPKQIEIRKPEVTIIEGINAYFLGGLLKFLGCAGWIDPENTIQAMPTLLDKINEDKIMGCKLLSRKFLYYNIGQILYKCYTVNGRYKLIG